MDYHNLFQSQEVQQLANTMCDIAAECWNLGLSDSTGFSISAKIPNTPAILVDKSGTGFRRNKISPSDLLIYDEQGELLYKPEGSDNPRLAPVNTVIHLAGYRANKNLQGCVHWHDPYILAFAGTGKDIPTYTLQSKLIGKVRCIKVDDRKEKEYFFKNQPQFDVPSGVHTRPDVLWSMNKVADKAADIIMEKGDELEKHGIVISQFEHGFFAWGRTVDEAFENAYRARRNAQALLLSKLS